jgi:hypothetical protein
MCAIIGGIYVAAPVAVSSVISSVASSSVAVLAPSLVVETTTTAVGASIAGAQSVVASASLANAGGAAISSVIAGGTSQAGVAASVAQPFVTGAITSIQSGTASVLGASVINPVGALLLGAKETNISYDWTCWRPVLREYTNAESESESESELELELESLESKGIPVQKCLSDTRIKNIHQINVMNNKDEYYFIVTNIWEETFLLSPVYQDTQLFAYHAEQINL